MKRGKKLFTYLLVLVMLLANTVTGVAAELDEPLQEATQIVHEDGSGLLSEGGLLEAGDAVADSSYDHSHDAAIVAAMENMQDTHRCDRLWTDKNQCGRCYTRYFEHESTVVLCIGWISLLSG